MAEFEKALPIVLMHEGKYVNDPVDPGGATNAGITLKFLKSLPLELSDINHDGIVDINDLKELNNLEIAAIYHCRWNEAGYGAIQDQMIATKLFDLSVNMGTHQANKLIQRAINSLYGSKIVDDDGALDSQTIAAINRSNPTILLVALRNKAEDFYRLIVSLHPEMMKFLNGWIKRANS